MRSLIIFAGAGASRGVSEKKYPMALDFRKRLPDSITGSQLYAQINAHLRQGSDGERIDIEHVLWELGRIRDNLSEWTDGVSFANYILKTNQIGAVAKANHNGQQTLAQFSALKNEVDNLQNKINERVYDFYSQTPDDGELNNSWVPLLEYLKDGKFQKVDIVTTNYDLVIETALERIKGNTINNGFKQGVFPGIDLELWQSEGEQGLLTKLHGSVDWKLGNGGTVISPVIRRGHPEFDGDHTKRLILYPGFKGIPAKEPFISFHNYFRDRLRLSTHILFIGFAFRDDYINDLIKDSVSQETKMVVVNPSDSLPPHGFLRAATHIRKGFGLPRNSTLLSHGSMEPFTINDLEDWIE